MNRAAHLVKCNLPYIKGPYRDRHGKWRTYFRRKGWASDGMAIHGEPGSQEFLESYRSALAAGPDSSATPAAISAAKAPPGTLDALREEYLGSAEFKTLRVSTQRETRYALDALCSAPHVKSGTRGRGKVAHLERRHILRWRDDLAHKPGAANKMIRIVKLLLTFAVDRGYRQDNPARGIRLLKGGRWRAWTDRELSLFEARWPLGTLERTGYALALYTGQRREDVTKMQWRQIAGSTIRVTQGKTGRTLEVPLHPELKKALMAVAQRHEAAIVAVRKGTKKEPIFTAAAPVYFGHRMATAIEAAGLPDDCVFHGLRKTTARVLAELGVDSTPITGHLTDEMKREYERDASQAKMARRAIVRWSRAKGRTKDEPV